MLVRNSFSRLLQKSSSSLFVRGFSAPNNLSYSEKQEKLGRPVSPHVTIYNFPVAALTSITNRATGVGLTVGAFLVADLHLLGFNVPELAAALGSSPLGPLVKLTVGFPLVYHYFAGLRHLMWDRNPESLTNEAVEGSNYKLLAVVSAVSVALAIV